MQFLCEKVNVPLRLLEKRGGKNKSKWLLKGCVLKERGYYKLDVLISAIDPDFLVHFCQV
jgi:hypothetical protein